MKWKQAFLVIYILIISCLLLGCQGKEPLEETANDPTITNSSDSAIIPDILTFAGDYAAVRNEKEGYILLEGYYSFRNLADAYMELLENDSAFADFTYTTTIEAEGKDESHLFSNGEEFVRLYVRNNNDSDNTIYLLDYFVEFSRPVEFSKNHIYEWPELIPNSPTVPQTPSYSEDVPQTPTDTTIYEGAVLPDLQSFGNNKFELSSKEDGASYTEMTYVLDHKLEFMNEYMHLLESYDFVLRDSKETTSLNCYDMVYDYVGSTSASTFDYDESNLDCDNISLGISIIAASDNNMEIHIYYADGITYADTGERTTISLADFNSSQSNNSNSDSDSDCFYCGGSKRCSDCGGDGYLSGRYVSGIWTEPPCSCGGGGCRWCN